MSKSGPQSANKDEQIVPPPNKKKDLLSFLDEEENSNTNKISKYTSNKGSDEKAPREESSDTLKDERLKINRKPKIDQMQD